tara:strand:+ start:2845 stop:3198 length:354 start_codon:yes stop_codon:yes gene_type:complete
MEGLCMLDKISNEEELILEISALASKFSSPKVIETFLRDTLEFVRKDKQDMKLTVMLLRRFVLQTITRNNGKRKKATELTTELLRCVGEYEANYFSNFIANLEKDLQEQGRSFFVKD